MKSIALFIFISFTLLSCQSTPPKNTDSDKRYQILPVSKVNWEKLNPARGDKSPQAATLWGDRKANVATGFLAKFVDGFSSPPHIHNVSYKGIVISGLIHNDVPKAANMWMPAVSYWTQPAGEAHITSAKGKENIAFIEINSGPYLVRPTKEAFDNGERPINVHSSNIVWQKKNNFKWVNLWQNEKYGPYGQLIHFKDSIKLPNFEGKLVLISGQILRSDSIKDILDPGSLLTVHEKSEVRLQCNKNQPCVIYLKSKNRYL